MKKRCLALAALLALALLLPGASPVVADSGSAQETTPTVTLGEQTVRITGITAGAEVVCFGIGRAVDEDDVAVVRRVAERAADADGDGVVELPLQHPVAQRSAWLAVDLKSGAYHLAAPAGFTLPPASWRGRGVLLGRGAHDQLEEARPFAEILLVRPGTGVWTLRLGDGGDGDEDGRPDGLLHAAVDRMQPLGASPTPPARLQPQDVVALFDPNTLEVIVTRIGAANP